MAVLALRLSSTAEIASLRSRDDETLLLDVMESDLRIRDAGALLASNF